VLVEDSDHPRVIAVIAAGKLVHLSDQAVLA
jgi:alpha-D-ribose 1-methylphosphonate 5-triphosphate diphosphatase